MKSLREMIEINNPVLVLERELEDNRVFDLQKIVQYFPKNHQKVFSSETFKNLWGTERLTWHGMKFFDGHNIGEAYQHAEKAALDVLHAGEDVEYDLVFGAHEDDFELSNHSGSFTCHYSGNDFDSQECFLGYVPSDDVLVIGFDVSVSEETFNQEFDDAFKAATGEEFDYDNEAHRETYDATRKAQSTMLYYWAAVDIHSSVVNSELGHGKHGGFYQEGYHRVKQSYSDLVELRLD